MDANIRLDHNLIALETEQDVHVMLELSTPLAAEDASRQPLRLALVLDRSGSMGGPKLENAKRCAAWLAGRLRGADELALVNFDDEVRLLAPLGSPEAAAQVIPHIRSGGSTNLSGGWLKGVEQLRGAGSTFLSGKVLLLTDGLANVGISDSATLVELTRNAAGAKVGTSTVGFGDGFDEALLTAMADAGGGTRTTRRHPMRQRRPSRVVVQESEHLNLLSRPDLDAGPSRYWAGCSSNLATRTAAIGAGSSSACTCRSCLRSASLRSPTSCSPTSWSAAR
jgi:Ca-activated chloride channel family protein